MFNCPTNSYYDHMDWHILTTLIHLKQTMARATRHKTIPTHKLNITFIYEISCSAKKIPIEFSSYYIQVMHFQRILDASHIWVIFRLCYFVHWVLLETSVHQAHVRLCHFHNCLFVDIISVSTNKRLAWHVWIGIEAYSMLCNR